MTSIPESTVSSVDAPPIPESLLGPLLDAAADSFGSFSSELPAVLRPLIGFDRRGLSHGPARVQLQRAIEIDPAFRDYVCEVFISREATIQALADWDIESGLEVITDAAQRSDLALLASALYAARPSGWEFGLGLIVAQADQVRSDDERADDAKARQTEIDALIEARRRAEDSRAEAENKAKNLEDQLKEERRSRRERELVAERTISLANKKDQAALAAIAAAEASVSKAESLTAREADRARAAESALRDLRRESGESVAPSPPLSSDDLHVLTQAANTARQLATRLEGLVTTTQVVARTVATNPADGSVKATKKRIPPTCPPGLIADSPDALDATLRTRGIYLVVDGYNISMTAWPEARISDQRERLLVALDRLHQRLRCDVVVVFDGSDAAATVPAKRPGVRVIFSTGGEKADPVVVREVDQLPANTSVIVASSDRWVAEHSEDLGALAVSASSLVEVLRR